MSDLAAFRTGVLRILDDPDGLRYTTEQVEQALRAALDEYSRTRPLAATINIDGTGEPVIEMPADFQPFHVLKVELHGEELPQEPLKFNAWMEDSQWFLFLADRLVAASESLDITYATAHAIDGLDSAAGTTVPAEAESAIQMGAAGFAALMRAASRAESVNLQPGVAGALLELSSACLRDFRQAIRRQAGAEFASIAVPQKGIV
jgi:hypothetical protein